MKAQLWRRDNNAELSNKENVELTKIKRRIENTSSIYKEQVNRLIDLLEKYSVSYDDSVNLEAFLGDFFIQENILSKKAQEEFTAIIKETFLLVKKIISDNVSKKGYQFYEQYFQEAIQTLNKKYPSIETTPRFYYLFAESFKFASKEFGIDINDDLEISLEKFFKDNVSDPALFVFSPRSIKFDQFPSALETKWGYFLNNSESESHYRKK